MDLPKPPGGRRIKKRLVEDSHKLRVYDLTGNLYPGFYGVLTWNRNGRRWGRVAILVMDRLESIRLYYSLAQPDKPAAEFEYLVRLQTTPLPWGGVRYWFTCPDCGRRVACLYLPELESIFKCWRCHNLTWASNQAEAQHKRKNQILDSLGLSRDDVKTLIFKPLESFLPPPDKLERLRQSEAHLDRRFHKQSRQLTQAELLDQSGLDLDSLAALESGRLLVPDYWGGYRPKQAGWGRKLAYLLGAGWTLGEIRAWAKGRWAAPDPRAWPPRRGDWQEADSNGL